MHLDRSDDASAPPDSATPAPTKTLSMTLVYAKIANRTVANEYFSVSEKVEALYDQPKQLPADAEGNQMRRLRAEMHRRMLGNGYCARPVELDCHFESICESCTNTSPPSNSALPCKNNATTLKPKVKSGA